ncbi:MAG TPA: nucleoside phosphorylase, partial [Flavipsychrobacter sp.]|nr:nucleoside phosphorylase [Flavipsychrobacter sp.]
GTKRITVVGTGIGPDNIDIVLNELDALANIDFATRLPNEQHTSLTIIRMGTCGSLQPDVPTDSFVASTYGIGLDNLLHYYQHHTPKYEQELLNDFIYHTDLQQQVIVPYIAAGNPELLQAFHANFSHGITVTSPGFYAPQGRVLRAAVAFPELIDKLSTFSSSGKRITNFEMETSAIYGLGKLLGHRCISLNTVVNNRLEKTFSKDTDAAIDRMIVQSFPIIEKL